MPKPRTYYMVDSPLLIELLIGPGAPSRAPFAPSIDVSSITSEKMAVTWSSWMEGISECFNTILERLTLHPSWGTQGAVIMYLTLQARQ